MSSIASIGLAHTKLDLLHCGVFYEAQQGTVELLHFATQGSLRSEAPSKYYAEVPSRFKEREKIAISDLCRLVHKNYSSAGLRYAATRTDEFLPNGILKVNKDGTGFTCATFVKNVFAVQTPLVVESSWPLASDQDKKWWEKMLALLRKLFPDPINRAHFDAIDPNCPWSRFRSEEIGAAAQLAPPAATFQQVKGPAKKLAKYVREAFAMLP